MSCKLGLLSLLKHNPEPRAQLQGIRLLRRGGQLIFCRSAWCIVLSDTLEHGVVQTFRTAIPSGSLLFIFTSLFFCRSCALPESVVHWLDGHKFEFLKMREERNHKYKNREEKVGTLERWSVSVWVWWGACCRSLGRTHWNLQKPQTWTKPLANLFSISVFPLKKKRKTLDNPVRKTKITVTCAALSQYLNTIKT